MDAEDRVLLARAAAARGVGPVPSVDGLPELDQDDALAFVAERLRHLGGPDLRYPSADRLSEVCEALARARSHRGANQEAALLRECAIALDEADGLDFTRQDPVQVLVLLRQVCGALAASALLAEGRGGAAGRALG
ncbi:hypothetical protein [Kitasatospora sp. NPDC088548]|uniref:hypothetical protein n=1 Tax=Kitasatospora sp. NPDC088548 TaxID=3364075 RepID=UPI0037FC1C6C